MPVLRIHVSDATLAILEEEVRRRGGSATVERLVEDAVAIAAVPPPARSTLAAIERADGKLELFHTSPHPGRIVDTEVP